MGHGGHVLIKWAGKPVSIKLGLVGLVKAMITNVSTVFGITLECGSTSLSRGEGPPILSRMSRFCIAVRAVMSSSLQLCLRLQGSVWVRRQLMVAIAVATYVLWHLLTPTYCLPCSTVIPEAVFILIISTPNNHHICEIAHPHRTPPHPFIRYHERHN